MLGSRSTKPSVEIQASESPWRRSLKSRSPFPRRLPFSGHLLRSRGALLLLNAATNRACRGASEILRCYENRSEEPPKSSHFAYFHGFWVPRSAMRDCAQDDSNAIRMATSSGAAPRPGRFLFSPAACPRPNSHVPCRKSRNRGGGGNAEFRPVVDQRNTGFCHRGARTLVEQRGRAGGRRRKAEGGRRKAEQTRAESTRVSDPSFPLPPSPFRLSLSPAAPLLARPRSCCPPRQDAAKRCRRPCRGRRWCGQSAAQASR